MAGEEDDVDEDLRGQGQGGVTEFKKALWCLKKGADLTSLCQRCRHTIGD